MAAMTEDERITAENVLNDLLVRYKMTRERETEVFDDYSATLTVDDIRPLLGLLLRVTPEQALVILADENSRDGSHSDGS